MRLTTILTLLTIFGIACLIFDSVGTVDTTSGNFLSPGMNATDTNSTTSPYLLNYLTDPTNLFNSSLWTGFWLALLATIGLSTVFSGIFRFTTSDAVTFAPMPILILAYGNFWIGTIFTFLAKELTSYMNPGATHWALMPTVLAMAFISIPAINMILGVLQMWRTGFTNT